MKTAETFCTADLVSFGNYLLSQERDNITSEPNKGNVTHADLENWRQAVLDGKVIHMNATPEFMSDPKNIALVNKMVQQAYNNLDQFKHPAPSEDWVEEVIKVVDSCDGGTDIGVDYDQLRTALQSVTMPKPKQLDLDEVLKWATNELEGFKAEASSFDESDTAYLRGVNLGCTSILQEVITKLNDLKP